MTQSIETPIRLILLLFTAAAGLAHAASGWAAGSAKVRITPSEPIWLAGYGRRETPSQGTAQELYARALALRDTEGNVAVLVATDMLGFPRDLADRIAVRAEEAYQLPRGKLLLNSSHTHAGPVVGRLFANSYLKMAPKDWQAVDEYTDILEDKIVEAIGQSIQDLSSAQVSFGRTKAGFAVNRRLKTERGVRAPFNNWEGPVDHDVSLLRIQDDDGALKTIVFGYACHNTAIRPDTMVIHGGWAGVAQLELEERFPGVTAMFVMGGGGDINPYPYGTVELAETHGQAMADTVEAALAKPFRPLTGILRSAYAEASIRFEAPPTRRDFEERLHDENPYRRIHAKRMLEELDREGKLPESYSYPLQVWQFGKDLTLIAMAGEVVVDYVLRLKRELGADQTWVVGFSNDLLGYVPSERILIEGGAEATTEAVHYNLPAPFARTIEQTIVEKVHELVQRVRRDE